MLAIDIVFTCVVLTGIPSTLAEINVIIVEISLKSALLFVSDVIFSPTIVTIFLPPINTPSPKC